MRLLKWGLTVFVVFGLVAGMLLGHVEMMADRISIDPDAETPYVSTRGHFEEFFIDAPALTEGHSAHDFDTTGDIPGLDVGECPEEMVIYVHGFDNDSDEAVSHFNETQDSLRVNGYSHPITGYSWDSDPGVFDFNDAENIANMNGPKLANFIKQFKSACAQAKVRLVGHSLGSRVILSALKRLRAMPRPMPRVQSVDVLGAAVDNEVVAKGDEFGDAIEAIVNATFWNYYNLEDDTLSAFYTVPEADYALGEDGAESGIDLPSNYNELDVTDEVGDDHSGYNRHSDDSDAIDPGHDGVMDKVKAHWDLEFFRAFGGASNAVIARGVIQLKDREGNVEVQLTAHGESFLNGGRLGIGLNNPSHPLHLASGAHVTAGGVWSNASSKSLKENVSPVNTMRALETLAALPIRSWNYKNETDSVLHIGPMAEDFYAAFGLGGAPNTISTVDANGVALVSIQALYALNLEKDEQIERLQAITQVQSQQLKSQAHQIQAFQAQLEALLDRVEQLEVNSGRPKGGL